jgi:hypothetical protein
MRRILRAITKKQEKGGAAYASGKTLVVFLNAGGGLWFPNKVARNLPYPLDFETVWVVSLQHPEPSGYIYAVTRLTPSAGDAPTWRVNLAADFIAWTVDPIQ